MTAIAVANEYAQSLAERGFCIVPGVLSARETKHIRELLLRGAAIDRERGIDTESLAGVDFDVHNTRLFNLLNYAPEFAALVMHPLALAFVHHLIGERPLLSNFSANVTRPGAAGMVVHADAGYLPSPWPPYPLGCNVAWTLDDTFEANGATRVMPGSHLKGHGPDASALDDRNFVSVEASAGSIYVIDGRLWHKTGVNRAPSGERACLFAFYVRPFVQRQWPFDRALRPDVLAAANDELRYMLTGNGTSTPAAFATRRMY